MHGNDDIQAQISIALGHLKAAEAILLSMNKKSQAATPEWSRNLVAENKCLECGKSLENIKKVRGLCESHYHSIMREIRETSLTMEAAIAAGRILPGKSGGRKKKKRKFEEHQEKKSVAAPAKDAVEWVPVVEKKESE